MRATDAALDYLEDLYAEFGDWHQAMAAYNCGEGRVRRQLRQDPSRTYWDMQLPRETRYYVPKILAAMIIGRNPEVFGFDVGESAHPVLRYDTATVTRALPLKGVAEAVSVPEDSIKGLNPALRRWSTPPGRDAYTLYLPPGSRDLFLANLARIDTVADVSLRRHRVLRGQTLSGISARYGVPMSALRAANGLRGSFLRAGQVLTIPVPDGREPAAVRTASGDIRHTVRPGETLSGIAARYRVGVSALRRANGMHPRDILYAGHTLSVPTGGRAESTNDERVARSRSVHTVRGGETLSEIAVRLRVSQSDLRAWNNLRSSHIRIGQKLVYYSAGAVLASASGGEYYRVRRGDNLWAISTRFGNTVDDLKRLNDGLSEDLRPGQRIRVR